MSAHPTDWLISVHRTERIIEVVYPEVPTVDSLERYENDIRRAIEEMNGVWDCLVDQRALPVLDAAMSQRIADLITWARERGMRHAARVVKRGSLPALQAKQLLRASSEKEEQNFFLTRDEAWAALLRQSTS